MTGSENEQAVEAIAKQLVRLCAVEVAQALKVKYVHKKTQAQKNYATKEKKLKFPRLKAGENGETLFSTNDTYDSLGTVWRRNCRPLWRQTKSA